MRQHHTLAVRFVVLRPLAFSSVHRMYTFARAVEHHVRHAHYDVVFGLGKTWTQDVIRLGGGCYQTYLGRRRIVTRTQRWLRRLGWGWYKSRQTLAIEARALAPGVLCAYHDEFRLWSSAMSWRATAARQKRLRSSQTASTSHAFIPVIVAGAGAVLRQQCGMAAEHVVLVFLGTRLLS